MNRRTLSNLIVLAALAALLTACGGGGQAVSPATAAPAAVTAVVSEAETAATSSQLATPTTAAPAAATASVSETQIAATPASSESTRLNLNQVTSEELLATIPGFSNRMVREFLEYRPYISIQQFRQEIGKYVDDAQVAEWEQYVYVPIAVDRSDAETLKQLPGVDDTIAQALIDGRPYGSNEAFLTKLVSQVGEAQAAAATAYLAAN